MKPFWKSKTFWVNGLALAGLLLQETFGLDLDTEIQAAILAVINLVLRAFTKEGISLGGCGGAGRLAAVILPACMMAPQGCATLRTCEDAALVIRDRGGGAVVEVTCDGRMVMRVEAQHLRGGVDVEDDAPTEPGHAAE